MQLIVRHIRRRIDILDERGFTILLALATMVVAMMLIGAAYVAVTSDTGLTRNDLDQKRAYTAAQAGLSQYVYQLNQNPNYWNTCAGANPNPVTGNVGAADAGSTETYSYKPLIATTAPSNDQHCDTANAIGTMVEGGNSTAPGTFRISSTGTSHGVSRTIVAQFKQPSFLNYVYYTDFETLDPVALYNPRNSPTEPTDCAVHYPNRGNDCSGPILFVSGDKINGPLHSEDTLAICGTPTLGRAGYNDAVETPALSTEGQFGCSNNATINNAAGAINSHAPSLTPPATNSQTLSIAQAGGYVYTGATTIVLNGNTMTVTSPGTTNSAAHPTGSNVAWPGNGVIYVSTAAAGCSVTYTPFTANAAYSNDTNCGNVYVIGNYTQSLTIASDNDIIIKGNISENGGDGTAAPTGGAELGLVANDFVRIYHPVTTNPGPRGTTGGACSGTNGTVQNATGSVSDIYVYAAILAVNHSFIVDNYDCGGYLGHLTVWGAIAQLFRGPVGISGQTAGYLKDYNYDDRLATTEPPYFLSPASTAWYISRQTECNGSSC
jgi:Tfp pilus assembly protein PilX